MNERVEQLILHYSSASCLNSLLWSTYFQTRRPDLITIVSSGRGIFDTGNISAINFISKEIPIKIHSINNSNNFGLMKETAFKLTTEEIIWYCDDDTLPRPNCLEEQLKYPMPNVPALIDIWIDKKISLADFEKKIIRKSEGSICGLLITRKDLLSLINLNKLSSFKVSEDNFICSQIEPFFISEAEIIHSKVCSNWETELNFQIVDMLRRDKNGKNNNE